MKKFNNVNEVFDKNEYIDFQTYRYYINTGLEYWNVGIFGYLNELKFGMS